MSRFYFTYSSYGHPFDGGWTEVEAPDGHAACAAFRAYHPDKTEGVLNCAGVYSEQQFQKTNMPHYGNFGYFCREIIHISRERMNKDV